MKIQATMDGDNITMDNMSRWRSSLFRIALHRPTSSRGPRKRIGRNQAATMTITTTTTTTMTMTMTTALCLFIILPQLYHESTSFSSILLVDAATTATSRPLLSPSSSSSSLSSSLMPRRTTTTTSTTANKTMRKRKRRNNTGFFYGIREDDIIGSYHYISTTTSDGNGIQKKTCRGQTSSSSWLAYFFSLHGENLFPAWRRRIRRHQQHRDEEQEKCHSEEQGQRIQLISTRPTTVQYPYRHDDDQKQILPSQGERMQGQVRTKKRMKRRKNNTGFYYGIREDVLIMPTIPSLQKPKQQQQQQQQPQSMLYPPANYLSSAVKPLVTHSTDSEDISIPSSPQSKVDDTTRTTNNNNNVGQNPTSPKSKIGTPTTTTTTTTTTLRPIITPNYGPKNKRKNKSSMDDNSNNIDVNNNSLFLEAIQELRGMREEIIALREELRAVKQQRVIEEEQVVPERRSIAKHRSTYEEEEEDSIQPKWWSQTRDEEISEHEEGQDRNNKEDEYETMPNNWKDISHDKSNERSTSKIKEERKEKLERIGKDVEIWASSLLSEEEGWGRGTTTTVARGGAVVSNDDDQQQQHNDDGWKEIMCNNFVKKKFNQFGQTRVFLKWMPDSRDENGHEARPLPLYPCLKCYSTIDAPLDRVCAFLANPETITMYNELIDDHRDVEVISPSSKITWCKVPKILFVKPRDFVTYCSHRWKRDGTQVIVNQACEHEDVPGVMVEGQGDVCRGFALRGANFISKDPDDPNRTRITMLSHANPGGGLPQWAMNTAVNAAVQVEPFKFFHKINESVCNYPETTHCSNSQSFTLGGDERRSKKPAGMAHLGFTCFWPNGGGVNEPGSHLHNHEQMTFENEEFDAQLEDISHE